MSDANAYGCGFQIEAKRASRIMRIRRIDVRPRSLKQVICPKENRMKHCHAQANQTTGRLLLVACVSALAGALTTSVSPPAHANPDLSPPLVPPNLEVPAQNKVFLVGHAAGTQQYICLFSGSSFDWTFFGPQATLFKNNKNQTITHFQTRLRVARLASL